MVRGVYLSRAGSERMTVEASLDRYPAEVTPTKKAATQRSERVTAKHLTSILGSIPWRPLQANSQHPTETNVSLTVRRTTQFGLSWHAQ